MPSARRSHAELIESPSGWTLTLTLDEQLIETIRRGDGAGPIQVENLTVSILPNLVPGTPFDVAAIRIVRPPTA